jgi:hypothetical protein
MDLDEKKLLLNLTEFLGLEFDKEKDLINYKYYKREGMLEKICIEKPDFTSINDNLKKMEFKDTLLYNSRYFEQLVLLPSESESIDKRKKPILIEDKELGFKYELSKPSREYLIASFQEFFKDKSKCPSLFVSRKSRASQEHDIEESRARTKRMANFISRRSIKIRNEKENKLDEFFKDFNRFLGNTIKIESSKKDLNQDSFKKLCDSFSFSLGYNLNLPLIEFRFLEKSIKPIQRLKLDEICAPQRLYNEKLIYYYQQALSGSNPVLEYLSFYQILEYFYDIVFKEDLVNDVKNKLINPDFSPKDKKSIEELIELVKEGKFEEKKALILVLGKYIDGKKLRSKLIEYDIDYYNYLTKKKVKFADADHIQEKSKNKDKFISKTSLADRIYKIRNALIHSKEGNEAIYVPFTSDEEILMKELPLIQFIAEQVIINSSDEINLTNLESTPIKSAGF